MAVDQSWFAQLDRAATSAGYTFVGASWDGRLRMLSVSMKYGSVIYNLSALDPYVKNIEEAHLPDKKLPSDHILNELEIQIDRIRVLK